MPFHSTRVWSDSVPRMKTEVALPGEPERVTVTPGTVRSSSWTLVAWRSSISSRPITVTVAEVSSSGCSSSAAVTTRVSS